jgi:hypothetical protein
MVEEEKDPCMKEEQRSANEERPTALSSSGRGCCWKHLEPSSAQWWAWVRNGGLFAHPHPGSAGDGLTSSGLGGPPKHV